MDLSTLKCICGQIYNEDQFSKHFRECRKFKDEFKEFDSKFGELLKTYSEPIERLIIVRYLLKQYIQVIERKITSRFKINKIPPKNKYQNNPKNKTKKYIIIYKNLIKRFIYKK